CGRTPSTTYRCPGAPPRTASPFPARRSTCPSSTPAGTETSSSLVSSHAPAPPHAVHFFATLPNTHRLQFAVTGPPDLRKCNTAPVPWHSAQSTAVPGVNPLASHSAHGSRRVTEIPLVQPSAASSNVSCRSTRRWPSRGARLSVSESWSDRSSTPSTYTALAAARSEVRPRPATECTHRSKYGSLAWWRCAACQTTARSRDESNRRGVSSRLRLNITCPTTSPAISATRPRNRSGAIGFESRHRNVRTRKHQSSGCLSLLDHCLDSLDLGTASRNGRGLIACQGRALGEPDRLAVDRLVQQAARLLRHSRARHEHNV